MTVSFNTGTETVNTVYSLLIQPNGKIIEGGLFSLVRFNPNGSFDLNLNSNDNIIVIYAFALALQSDGKIVVGGSVDDFNSGSYVRRTAVRINTNGILDTSFISPALYYGVVRAVVVQSDGKIVIGGTFFYSGTGTIP